MVNKPTYHAANFNRHKAQSKVHVKKSADLSKQNIRCPFYSHSPSTEGQDRNTSEGEPGVQDTMSVGEDNIWGGAAQQNNHC